MVSALESRGVTGTVIEASDLLSEILDRPRLFRSFSVEIGIEIGQTVHPPRV